MKWVIIALLLCTAALAVEVRSGEINLLALTENGSGQMGSVATLGLQVIPGDERVFLETFPMTKIATQASLRFAQQVSCRELDIDCSGRDFLFTIEALPGIVGGPSAGSAAALLMSALLVNKSVPKDVAVTGTINSGGIIGIVGGVKQKVEAAGEQGIKTVFVPKGTQEVKFGNKTLSVTEYGSGLNVTVIEVATLGELLEHVLGIPQRHANGPLTIDEGYVRVMQEVANDLCGRSAVLGKQVKNVSLAENLTARARGAMAQGEFYAAASYCFRANVDLKRAKYREEKLSAEEARVRAQAVRGDAEKLRENVDARNVSTITELQTLMAVTERIEESLEAIAGVERTNISERFSEDIIDELVYAEERLFSAKTWARFFDGSDKRGVVSGARLERSCAAKVSEAEERYNYVKSVIPDALDGTRGDIDRAYGLMQEGKFSLCLHTASKAKAEADVLLGALGVTELDEAVEIKLRVAREALQAAERKGIFPIIAYSYYEYANSLKDFDKVSSLLFAGYALELANVDMYFEEPHAEKKEVFVLPAFVGPMIVGFFAGAAVVFILTRPSAGREFKTLQAPPKRRLRGKKR